MRHLFHPFRKLLVSLCCLIAGGLPVAAQGVPARLLPVEPSDTVQKDTVRKVDRETGLPLKAQRFIPLKTDEGTWLSLDLSPDGQTLVFDMLGDLYTLPAAGGKATRISSGLAFDTQPRFSPDGQRIAFLSDRSGAENVWIMDRGKTILDTTTANERNGLRQISKDAQTGFASPEWTPDGQYILVSKSSGLGVNHLQLYHLEGGSGTDLFAKEKNRNAMGPAFGPDSRYVYFATKQGRWGYNLEEFKFQVAEYDRETGETFPLTAEVGGAVRPAVSPDGQWLVYASRHDAQTGFRLRNLRNVTDQWLAYPIQRDDQESRFAMDLLPGYTFTPDSKAIIASMGGKIYRIDVPSGKQTPIPFEVETTVALGARSYYETPVEEGPVKLRQIRYASYSPDHSRLVFTALDKLYVKEMRTSKIRKLTDTATKEFAPAWSPDGKFVAYVTWSEQAGGQVFKTDVSTGRSTLLSRVNAFYDTPVWTPDGREIIVAKGPWQQQSELSYFNFIPGEGQQLVRIPAEGGADKRVAPLKGINPHFADKNDRLYVYEGDSGLVSFRLDGTDRKVHAKVTGSTPPGREKPEVADEMLMSPDGEHALVMFNNSIYELIIPKIGADPPTISVANPTTASFPVKKITTVGGQYMGWTSGGREITWSLGNVFFEYSRTRAKAFDDSLRNAIPPKPAGVPKAEAKKDSTTKTFEPLSWAVELNVPRVKPNGTLVLRGARIYTMAPGASNEGIIENGAIVLIDNRIAQVGPSPSVTTPTGAKEIDVSGKILMPGLVDAHAHMWPAWGVHRGVVWEYLANLAYGVTTTRDPQTSTTDVLTYADLVEAGELIGPRIFHTGPGVFNGEHIKNLKDAQQVLKRYSQYYKTNTIKQYLSGDRNVRQWIIMAAKDQKLTPTTEGGLDLKLDVSQILDGYAGNEHSFPVSPLYKDMVTLVAQSGTYYTPTLLVSYGGPWAENYYYTTNNVHDDAKLRKFIPHSEIDKLTRRREWFHDDEHVFRLHAAQAKKIVEAGGRVCIGGHGQLQGLGYHWEVWSVQSGGMKPMDALRCATVFGAESIGMLKDLGSLEKGKLADLIVLDKDPLQDIHHTNSVSLVMKNGLLYDANTLDQRWPVEKKLPPVYWLSKEPGPGAK